jgi:hypothetical protein
MTGVHLNQECCWGICYWVASLCSFFFCILLYSLYLSGQFTCSLVFNKIPNKLKHQTKCLRSEHIVLLPLYSILLNVCLHIHHLSVPRLVILHFNQYPNLILRLFKVLLNRLMLLEPQLRNHHTIFLRFFDSTHNSFVKYIEVPRNPGSPLPPSSMFRLFHYDRKIYLTPG